MTRQGVPRFAIHVRFLVGVRFVYQRLAWMGWVNVEHLRRS